MSAELLDFPKGLRPDPDKAFRLLEPFKDRPAALFDVALMAMNAAQHHRERATGTAKEIRAVTDSLTLAFFALATILGIPREAEACLPPDGSA